MTLPDDNQPRPEPPFEEPHIPETQPPATPPTPPALASRPAGSPPPPPAAQSPYRRYRRPSFLFPLILIGIGIVVLLNNVGVISGNVWDQIIQLWPVILIAIGLDGIIRRDGVAGPVFWIGLGAVFLLLNLGIFQWDAFQVILNLWPLLIVAIGLDLLIGRRSAVGGLIAAIVMLAILAFSLWFVGTSTARTGGMPAQTFSQSVNGATSADLQFSPPFGTFTLKSGTGASLAQGEARLPRSLTLTQDYQVTNGAGQLQVATRGQGFSLMTGQNSWKWDVSVNPSIPVSIEVDMGMGNEVLDLSSLQISGLNSNFGMGRIEATLPDQGSFNGEVNGAFGLITLKVPRGLPLRVDVEGVLVAQDAPSDYDRSGNFLTSPTYDGSPDKIDIRVGIVFARLVVEYID